MSAFLAAHVEDPAERKAFASLSSAPDPKQRLIAAELFLEAYPQSWLLAQAYEIAAKAALDLGDFPRGLAYGAKSLRLLPESPLLLVSLAGAQLQQGLFADAQRSARNALHYLERFARPAGTPEKEWTALEPRLRSTSHYFLGRALLSEGLGVSGTRRTVLLRQAVTSLRASARLDPADAEPVYLLGLSLLALGDSREAGIWFANAARREGAVQQRALAELRKLHQALQPVEPFERFLAALSKSEPAPEPTSPSPQTKAEEYAGSESCKSCHAREHEAWLQTGMARMLRPYHPENVPGLNPDAQFAGPDGTPVARMKLDGNRHTFEIRRDSGRWDIYPVDYTIGSKWQQAYATRARDGRIHVFPVQYNLLRKEWLNYWRIIDPPGSERAEVGRFHRMTEATNYQMHCASCHTSQLRTQRTDRAPESFQQSAFREAGVNCEMCHGPSARHASAMKAGQPYAKAAIDPPVDFGRVSASDYVAICAQCHMQSAVRELGAMGEMNYVSGERFFRRYRSRPYGEFLRKAFYKDGRFRETTFIVESFLRSRCFKEGQAHCGSCHNPHPADAADNKVSLKFRSRPDERCLQCHSKFRTDVARHTHHPVESEGSRCESCHMPRIMNSLLFMSRTHTIDDIPDAAMTLRFGEGESPNACLLCHNDKTAIWLEEQLAAW